jgi:hypothetical protein
MWGPDETFSERALVGVERELYMQYFLAYFPEGGFPLDRLTPVVRAFRRLDVQDSHSIREDYAPARRDHPVSSGQSFYSCPRESSRGTA